MQQTFRGAACALLLACAQPVLAADFHPLESLSLSGGIYEFDNIFIPEDVTLSFEGEDRLITLRAGNTLILRGSLIAPGWQITLQAQRIEVSGRIDVGGEMSAPSGTPVVVPGAGLGGIDPLPGARLSLRGGDGSIPRLPVPTLWDTGLGGDLVLQGGARRGARLILRGGDDSIPPLPVATPMGTGRGTDFILLSPVPEPETWAMLLAGLGLIGLAVRRNRDDTKP